MGTTKLTYHRQARRGWAPPSYRGRLDALPVGAVAYRPGGACGRLPWLAFVAASPLFRPWDSVPFSPAGSIKR